MTEILTMGDYTPYVWSCFGLTAFVVGYIEWQARRRQTTILREIEVRVRATEGQK